jgi:hypothetical protein
MQTAKTVGLDIAKSVFQGGLNSRISNWQNAVINAMEEFKNDFRCITMDQRNATNGESTGPIPFDNPWDAFADDQLGLLDHLGIRWPKMLCGERRMLSRSGATASEYRLVGSRRTTLLGRRKRKQRSYSLSKPC